MCLCVCSTRARGTFFFCTLNSFFSFINRFLVLLAFQKWKKKRRREKMYANRSYFISSFVEETNEKKCCRNLIRNWIYSNNVLEPMKICFFFFFAFACFILYECQVKSSTCMEKNEKKIYESFIWKRFSWHWDSLLSWERLQCTEVLRLENV